MTPWPGAGWQSACASCSAPALHAAGCPVPVPHSSQRVALLARLIAAWSGQYVSCTVNIFCASTHSGPCSTGTERE